MGWQDRDYHREDSGGGMQIRFPPLTPLAGTLIGVNLLLFLVKVSDSTYSAMLDWGALTFTSDTWWQTWRWITYQYIHGGGGHVFFNMLALYFFVPTLEQRWGWQRALVFYTLGGIAAGVCYFLMVAITGFWGSFLIGASGSTLAMLGAVAYLYPDVRIFMVIPIRVFTALLGVLYILTVVGDRSFADAAHLGGLAFGYAAPWLAGPVLNQRVMAYRRAQKDRAFQSEIDEQKEVDRILAKVAEQGMASLTSREKKALAQATENQRKRDQAKEKRIRSSW